MLLHRGWFILACTALGLACSAAYVLLTKPVFESSTTLRMDSSRASSLGLGDSGAGSADAGQILQTEIAMIHSDAVAVQALNALPDSAFYQFTGLKRAPLAGDQTGRPLISTKPLEPLPANQQAFVDRLKAETQVSQVEGTQLVEVRVRDQSPQLAASLANHLTAAYMYKSLASRDSSVSQLQEWLTAEMTTLREQVDASQKKLAAYQEANDIVGTGTSNTVTDRLRSLNERLGVAQADRIAKEAQLQAAMKSDPAALASLFQNPKLEGLETEQGSLSSRYAQLSAKFGVEYPPLAQLKKQRQSIDGEVNNEVRSVLTRLRQEYAAASSIETALKNEYDQQIQAVNHVNRGEAEYEVLKTEVVSSRELYDALRRKLQQANVDAHVSEVNTMVVDSARPVSVPVAPKKTMILLSGLFLGLFAGSAAALLSEATSKRLRSEAQVERSTGLPVLASLPVSSLEQTAAEQAPERRLVTLAEPASREAESYRKLRNRLTLFDLAGTSQSLLIGSANAEEGVSLVTANLAVTLALTNLRVLVVDTNLRAPGLHRMFSLGNEQGLADQLRRPMAPASFRRPIAALDNLFVMPAGEGSSLPSEAIASARFQELLKEWGASFDCVVLEAAPLLQASDGSHLMRWANAVALVTTYNRSDVDTLQRLKQSVPLREDQLLGVVIRNALENLDE